MLGSGMQDPVVDKPSTEVQLKRAPHLELDIILVGYPLAVAKGVAKPVAKPVYTSRCSRIAQPWWSLQGVDLDTW
ncbi:hypothetical protein E4U09_000970 [Claviceps aff. purpurea]|uniref:Uncharacterized protein n=1 Tax=Claviceps aff. purpurea TaxID=1967640 RepID=A0A9P7QHV8_9HYPO|nr:hypothetical protein E4U09_000970 [Claviceps aff. purpurea]